MTNDITKGRIRDEYMASAHLQERREPRYALKVKIEVSGVNRVAQTFRERTVTENVSEWGCQFSFPIELASDDIIAVRTILENMNGPEKKQQAMFQVVRVDREEGTWMVAAWKMEKVDLWGVQLAEMREADGSSLDKSKIVSTND